ncbi:MAG: MFS transporter [Lachnospiraceae bacterium]|nr:MFS transporter [Lachnospiraceae bacterium]
MDGRKLLMRSQVQSRKKNHPIQVLVVVASVCVVFAMMQGVHDNYGIMLNGLVERTGLDYASVSFVIGVGALLYGVAQPFIGMLALKKSNSFVMLLGIALIAAGLLLTPFSRNFFALLISFGIILPVGTTGLASGILMSAITPIVGERRSVLISGFLQASAGVGDALMAPGMERLIAWHGIAMTMIILAVPFLVMIPIALWIGKLDRQAELTRNPEKPDSQKEQSLRTILSEAFRDRNYRLILIGFGTCGFNMSIIESHLFSQYVSYGIPGNLSSLTLTVYGITTMLGAILTGYLGTRFKMKNVLGTVYAVRVLISLGFLLLPKSVLFAFVMTGLLGVTGDSTVPPTMGTISRTFGAKKMPVLYGFALVGHQIGAFASAALGGQFVKAGLGYAPLWIVNMILAAAAAAASYRIREVS